jgi:N-acetylneuraminic acid mutarotase
MNKCFLGFVLFLLAYQADAQDYWYPRDTVKGSPKSVIAATSFQNIGLIIGGLDDFGFKRKMYSYSPFQDDWDEEVSLGGASGEGLERGSACAFTLYHENMQKAYVCLGQTQTVAFMKDLWEFNPQTETWSQKANYTGSARRQAVCFTAANLAYVGTGESAAGLKNDFYSFNPETNSWTQRADFEGSARRDAVAFELNGFGFVGTGDDGTLKNDLWMYDVQSDTWVDKAPFPGPPRAGAVAWGAFPVAYVGTGEDGNGDFHNDLYEYNYFLNAWVQRANIPASGRKNAFAFYINGVSYVGAGYNGTFLEDFWAYSGTAGLNSAETVNVNLYPNPVQNQLMVQSKQTMENITVHSMDGKQLASESEAQQQFSMDVSNWKSGTYLFCCEINGIPTQKTFVKCD